MTESETPSYPPPKRFTTPSTYASLPGELQLSIQKLRVLAPELLGQTLLKCGPTCDLDHTSDELRERLAEFLHYGCCNPAAVVSLQPLIVSVATTDLDAAILLRFPATLVERYGLHVGSRLLAVCTFADWRGQATGARFYAVDLIPGPKRTNWSNASPLIAQFLCDDADAVAERMSHISEDEWRSLDALTAARVERWGLLTARDGRPHLAGFPARMGGQRYMQPIEGFDTNTAGARGSSRAIALAALLATALVLWLVAR